MHTSLLGLDYSDSLRIDTSSRRFSATESLMQEHPPKRRNRSVSNSHTGRD